VTKKILVVVGTRPNFIKVTRFKEVAAAYKNIEVKIVHTGQHFDVKMADIFFQQFSLTPDFFLNINSASANTQMAEIMLGLEKLISEYKPSLLLVVGDVNSTFAAALTANKTNTKFAHIESGLRSFDKTMPEEHNRVLTDEIADFFFITEQSGMDHLITEGKSKDKLFFVGNTMIDTMVKFSSEIERSNVLQMHSLEEKKYVLVTMHRPATVDTRDGLLKLYELLKIISVNYKILFPVHPRTLKNLEKFNLDKEYKANTNLILTEPLDYFSFQKLIKYSKFILTDSGGIQEESTFLRVPCLTLRPNTERPVTITTGTNELLPFDIDLIKVRIKLIENGNYKKGEIPYLWDGKSTERIFEALNKIL